MSSFIYIYFWGHEQDFWTLFLFVNGTLAFVGVFTNKRAAA